MSWGGGGGGGWGVWDEERDLEELGKKTGENRLSCHQSRLHDSFIQPGKGVRRATRSSQGTNWSKRALIEVEGGGLEKRSDMRAGKATTKKVVREDEENADSTRESKCFLLLKGAERKY